MKHKFIIALSLLAGIALCSAAKADDPTPEEQARIQKITDLKASLHPQYGDVRVFLADVTLHLGQDYYFLGAEDAKKVLVEAWGNPPDQASNVIGMVFKDRTSFIEAQWGAVVTFDGTGYVSDEDSKTADYDAILSQMREGEAEENAERKKQGYEPIHLVGWAQTPSYDPLRHTVVWARDLRFGEQTDDTLNYAVRVLGRRGFLSLNMISTVSALPDVDSAAKKLATVAAYNPGARYEDYSPSSDTKAEYGLAGLVAAGVGVAVAQKVGLLAVLLLFAKKFFIFGFLIVAALFSRIKRLFSRNR